MNAIGGDTIDMLRRAVKEAADNFAALVVGNDGLHFSAGANLMLLLLEAQEGNWDEVDLMVRAFQGATMGLRNADVPVVVAPAGLTLGGGCEIVAARRPRAGRGGELHRPRRSRRRTDSRRRRHEGNAGALDGRAAAGRRRAAVRPARVRDDRVRHRLDERPGCQTARLSARERRHHDESRPAARRRQRRSRCRSSEATCRRSRDRSRSAVRTCSPR